LRAAASALREALPYLEGWDRLVAKKLDVMQLVVQDPSVMARSPAAWWDPESLRLALENDASFDERAASSVLAIVRRASESLNIAAAAVKSRESKDAIAHVIAAFVDVEVAVYARHPKLDPDRTG
jgi:hypothetical protein